MKGMFPKTRNLESSFRLIRGMCVVVVIGAFGLCGYVFVVANQAVNRAQVRVYILANGKALEAVAGDRKENIPVEARDHIRNFHQYFFTLGPMKNRSRRASPGLSTWRTPRPNVSMTT